MQAAELKQRLAQFYSSASEEPSGDVPRYLRVLEWTGRAANFIEASTQLTVDGDAERYFYPRMLLSGHALECALKAALIAAGHEPETTHDLVSLADHALTSGFLLSEPQLALIVHVDHYFHRDLKSATKFKARYPTRTFESEGGAAPPGPMLASIVQELRLQTSQLNERLNRSRLSGEQSGG